MGANHEKWVQIKKNACKSKLSKLAKITTFDIITTKHTEVTNDGKRIYPIRTCFRVKATWI